MEQIPPEECASKLFEAVHLFINYSVQDYISRGIIQANEKPRFMRELWGQLDSFSDRGGDIMKAEFIAHLCNIVALTEREAIDLTTEYIKRCEKLERNRY